MKSEVSHAEGTTLAFGEWGIRIKENGARITQKQLLAAEDAIRKKIKPIKGAKVFIRVFPDIPVCIKVCWKIDFGVSQSGSHSLSASI